MPSARRTVSPATAPAIASLVLATALGAAAAPAPSAPAASAPPGPDYVVRLARPVAAGDKRLAVGWLRTDDRLAGTRDGKPSDQRQLSTIHYVVATEILEASPRGNAVRATFTVRRLTKESGGVSLELAKPGEVVQGRLAGRERVLELRGARLAPDLQQALGAAVPLRPDDEPTDDDLVGSAERRRAGESWPVNGALFATLGAAGMVFDPKEVSGTATLAAIRPAGGVPCLDVRWKLEARHGSWKPGSLPLGFSGTGSSLALSGSILAPVDPALPLAARETSLTLVADVTGAGEDGAAASLHHELRQVVHVELSKVP